MWFIVSQECLMADPQYESLKPLPMKDRVSMIFLRYGLIDVKDSAFVLVDEEGVRCGRIFRSVQLPVSG